LSRESAIPNPHSEINITGEDGLKALEVALGAYKSRDTGQLVRLPME